MAEPVLSSRAIDSLTEYCKRLLEVQKGNSEFRDKMDWLNYAYARYTEAMRKDDQAGVDVFSKVECETGVMPVVTPVVISNCQSMVAYLSEVFLSGYPIFPVVSDPIGKDNAEALEGIIQDHIVLGAGDAEMQVAFNDAVRYNVACLETAWAPILTYNPNKDISDFSIDNRIKMDYKHFNRIKRWDLYNTFWDTTPELSKVSEEGEFIGHTELINRVRLKDHLNYLSNEKLLVSNSAVNEALASSMASEIWNEPPQLDRYMTSSAKSRIQDWDSFCGFKMADGGTRKIPVNDTNRYLHTTIYARIIPLDHYLPGPNRSHVQIWKLELINNAVLIRAQKINTPYNKFPAVLFPAIEDGLDMQAQSYAQMTQPIQEATTRLLNAKFQMNNRLIVDRALFNPDMVRASDLNAKNPSGNIPVRANALLENPFDSAYRPIPFNFSGSESLLQDAMLINSWQDGLTGINAPGRGQFQKGNKTLGEFQTVMGNSDNRARMAALVIDRRGLTPIKEAVKLNIFMYGEDTTVIAPRTSRLIEVEIEDLIASNMQFEMADGYTPKSKIANTDMLMSMINLISTSPQLQQTYGPQLPAMIAHLAKLGGLRGFDQYAATAMKEYEKAQDLQVQMIQMMQKLQAQMGPQAPVEGDPNVQA